MPTLAIATMTWARAPEEAEQLFGAVQQLSRHGLPVVIADGGSTVTGFTDRLRGLPGVSLVLPRLSPGRLVGQVQAALEGAEHLGAEHIFYTEPDKLEFFSASLDDFLATLSSQPDAGMLLASRDPASFATFPAGQQLTEALFNRLAEEALGVASDTLYGPLLLRSELVPHITHLHEDLGWGWRPYLMAITQRLGLPIVCREGSYPCPAAHLEEDDLDARVYRMEQLAQNVRGLASGLKASLNLTH
ncbi:MAG: hypothetical protein ACO1SX_27690 [Actinomycetota bacterium]